MNIAAEITLDGLVRALRWRAHDLAERIEGGYANDKSDVADAEPAGRDQMRRRARGTDDDRAGR